MKILSFLIAIFFLLPATAQLKSTDMNQKRMYENIGGSGGSSSDPEKEAKMRELLEELKKTKATVDERNKLLNDMLDNPGEN